MIYDTAMYANNLTTSTELPAPAGAIGNEILFCGTSIYHCGDACLSWVYSGLRPGVHPDRVDAARTHWQPLGSISQPTDAGRRRRSQSFQRRLAFGGITILLVPSRRWTPPDQEECSVPTVRAAIFTRVGGPRLIAPHHRIGISAERVDRFGGDRGRPAGQRGGSDPRRGDGVGDGGSRCPHVDTTDPRQQSFGEGRSRNGLRRPHRATRPLRRPRKRWRGRRHLDLGRRQLDPAGPSRQPARPQWRSPGFRPGHRPTAPLRRRQQRYLDLGRRQLDTADPLDQPHRPDQRRHGVRPGDKSGGPLGGVGSSTVLDDTWSWDGTTWTQQTPAASPPARSGATLSPGSGQLILFGGTGPTGFLGDTWTWDGATWTEQQPANSPTPREGASAAYDSTSGQLVLYGGLTLDFWLGGGDYTTWTWEGTVWAEPADTSNAGGRFDASMAYDAGTDQIVLFGGNEDGSVAAETAVFGVASGDATFSYPHDNQAGVDAASAFTWSPIASAQGYALAVGTTPFGTDIAQSAVLPPTQTSYQLAALPVGRTIYATVLTQLDGVWGYHTVTFNAAPGDALTYPIDGQATVSTSKPFTWSTIAASQGAILVIGTKRFGTDLVNSGPLAAQQNSYRLPPLPAGKVLYATLLTKTNGQYTRYQAITFTQVATR
jgi:hypothetical protein